MQTRTDEEFLDWLSGASIYIGYDRYAQFGGWGFICATKYDDSEELRTIVQDLSGGDGVAYEAGSKLKSVARWIGSDPDPVKAMEKMLDTVRKFYFHDLNKGDKNGND